MKNSLKLLIIVCALIFNGLKIYSQKIAIENINSEDIDDQEYLYTFTEATKYYLFGNYVQAVTLYNACMKRRPQSSAVHFQLSKIYLNSGNVALAREHAKMACKYTPDNKWYLQELGDIFQMEQKYDSAVLVYKQLLRLENNNIGLFYSIASMYEKSGEMEKSLAFLDSIDNKIGLSKEVSLSKYRIYETKNQPKDALNELKTALKLSDEDYSVYGMMAEFYRNHNMPDSAERFYRIIYPKYKSDPAVVFSYADFMMDVGKKDSAERILINVINDSDVDNNTKSAYFYQILQNEQLFKTSGPFLDTLIEVYYRKYNNDIRSISIYSDIQMRLKNYAKAGGALERIVNTDANNYPAFEQLVYALNMQGKTDSVIYFSDRAIRLFSDKPVMLLFNGSAKFQKGEYDAAVDALNKGLAITEDKALQIEFHSLLAECYQSLKQYNSSDTEFNAALRLDPENIGVLNNYAYYLSLREVNLKQALKMSKVTINAEPKNSTYLDTYAWVLFKMGKAQKAKNYIIQAINEGGSSNKDIIIHYAEILLSLKEYKEALKYYTNCSKNG